MTPQLTVMAAGTDRTLVDVTTNLRELARQVRNWGWAYPYMIAAVGLLLEARYGRLLVSADSPYSELYTTGISPVVTPRPGSRPGSAVARK